MLGSRTMQRGDTLIEVLLAMTLMSVVAVASITLMNRGTHASQVASETTIARQEMESQVERLRYLSDMAINEPGSPEAAEWSSLLDRFGDVGAQVVAAPTDYGHCPPDYNGELAKKTRFYLQRGNAASNYAITVEEYQHTLANPIAVAGEGIWVEASKENAADRYTDFHVRACWRPPSDKGPNITLGTVVRLYEP